MDKKTKIITAAAVFLLSGVSCMQIIAQQDAGEEDTAVNTESEAEGIPMDEVAWYDPLDVIGPDDDQIEADIMQFLSDYLLREDNYGEDELPVTYAITSTEEEDGIYRYGVIYNSAGDIIEVIDYEGS